MRQEDHHEFETSLSYRAETLSQTTKEQKRKGNNVSFLRSSFLKLDKQCKNDSEGVSENNRKKDGIRRLMVMSLCPGKHENPDVGTARARQTKIEKNTPEATKENSA